MKIINFGSLNIDMVYHVEHFVQPGETILALACSRFAGGKGLNQSLAAARAGATVLHAGCIGTDGTFLTDILSSSGVDISQVRTLDAPSGHAIIQVNRQGQNSIIVFGGSNQMLTKEYIDSVLSLGDPGDIVLLQNEINLVPYIIEQSHLKGLTTAFNPSPVTEGLFGDYLRNVDIFLVNEIEGAEIVGVPQDTEHDDILRKLEELYPLSTIVLTRGSKGSLCFSQGKEYVQPIYPVTAVDTTAAGDTFCGYFLSGLCRNMPLEECLDRAAAASSIAVSRQGAEPSIPRSIQVDNKKSSSAS